MLARRLSFLFAMCLLHCTMQAQTLFIKSPVPVKISINGFISPDQQTEFSLLVEDTNLVFLRVEEKGLGVLRKTIALQKGETLSYQVEKNALDEWALFFRSNLDIRSTPVSYQTWKLEAHPEFLAVEHSRESFTEEIMRADTSKPSEQIKYPIDEFELIKNHFKSIAFEFERTQKIIEWGKENRPTVWQISELSKLTAYDPSRIMILRSLIEYCTDPHEYDQLKEVLQHEESKIQFQQILTQWKEKQ